MQFLTSLTARMSEAYLVDVEVKDAHRENETDVLCNILASFSSELRDWLLGCPFSQIRAQEPLLGKSSIILHCQGHCLPIEVRGDAQVRMGTAATTLSWSDFC